MSEATRGGNAADGSAGQAWIAAVLRAVLRLTLRRTFRADLPWERQRSRMLKVTRLTLPPRGTRFQPGACGGVPGEWVEARGAALAPLTILYLHGGGYCVGSPATHRALTGHLAARCHARVFAADYRLAPEHPFPAAVDDAVAAYRGLLEQGVQARDIVIAGDSAGGGLSAAAAVRLRGMMPNSFFLVPGYGTQGVTAADVAPLFKSDGTGALVSASRSIIYAYDNMRYMERFASEWDKAIEQACKDFVSELGQVIKV